MEIPLQNLDPDPDPDWKLPPSQSQFTVSPPDITTPSLTVDAITDSQQVEMPVVGDDGKHLRPGDDADRTTGSSGAGNRWPRQETLALLTIRSDMDSAFFP
ncbi:hypothetical protein SDJN03_18620, partial [Cucurbita argyrosperma subsp. sororia]